MPPGKVYRDTCRSCTWLYDIPQPEEDDEIAQLKRKHTICDYCAGLQVQSRLNREWNRKHRPNATPGRASGPGWFRRFFNL